MARMISAHDVLTSIEPEEFEVVREFVRRFNDCMGHPGWVKTNQVKSSGASSWVINTNAVHSPEVQLAVEKELREAGWGIIEVSRPANPTTMGVTTYKVAPING